MIWGEFDDKADCIPYTKVSHYFKNQIVEYLVVTNDVPKLLAMSSVYVLPS